MSGVHSSVLKRADVASLGGIDMGHISVGGSINLAGANLQCQPSSLALGNAMVADSLYLTDYNGAAFHASGSVSLVQAEIKKFLEVSGAELAELDCTGARINELMWINIIHPANTKLTLVRTKIKILLDVKNSRPSILGGHPNPAIEGQLKTGHRGRA